MRIGSIASAALALGLSAVVPAFAHAEQRADVRDNDRAVVRQDLDERYDRDDHDRYRHDRDDDRDRNVRYDVDARDVSPAALDRANHERHGWPIERIYYVRQDGRVFYEFRIDRRDMPDLLLTIEPDGDLVAKTPVR